MKQFEDNKTLELSLPLRGRGRPKNPGGPMSPAERQAARRVRLAASGEVFLTVHLSAELLAKLDQFVAKRENCSKSDAVEIILSDRLLRKR